MQKTGLKLTKINKQLSMLPDDKLNEVSDFIGFILSKNKVAKRKIVRLEGIWEGKGFEKLDIKKELDSFKKEHILLLEF